jgi:CopA family copper-resistance protein
LSEPAGFLDLCPVPASIRFDVNPSFKFHSGGTMRRNETDSKQARVITRRRIVQGILAGTALAACGWKDRPAFGEIAPPNPAMLTGTRFDLAIDTIPVNITGRVARATAVNGSTPGPILRWREGDAVTISLTNRLKHATSIHWHGIRVPAEMDGVPGLSFAGVAPGETFEYRFPVRQSGTYWYHSHSGFQEQTGLIGAVIIDPRDHDPIEFDREYVVLLSDWTDANPATIFSNLKAQSDYYNYHRLTLPNFISATAKDGFGQTVSQRLAWARMNMSPTDISDVTGAAYTYLLNGNSPKANWTGLFHAGERIRLRFINGSSMTFFDVRIPGLKMSVVQADGNDVEPVKVDEFRIGIAETYDVIVQPTSDTAYTIFAQSEDCSGFARGTLAPRMGMTAAVPPMDPVPMRTMADMGMANMKGMKMGDMKGMDMSGMAGMDMPGMAGMHKKDMPESSIPAAANQNMAGMNMDHSDMAGMEMGSNIATTPLAQPGPETTPIMPMSGKSDTEARLTPSHAVHLHVGPQVDNVAMESGERLHDAGDGLTGNGRRVLTYADLRARYRGADGRPPTREIELHLSGNMERYIWGFNGKKFSDAEPIELKLGERVRFALINDTMMDHPIHLHGLWSELENGHGEFNPYKHTVIVKPAERLTYLVTADTPGQWAYHCHFAFHMDAGMFLTVVVKP